MPNSAPARTGTVGLDDRIPIASASLLLLLFSNTPASQSVRNRTPVDLLQRTVKTADANCNYVFSVAQLRPPCNRAPIHPSVARSEQTPLYMSARLILPYRQADAATGTPARALSQRQTLTPCPNLCL